MNTSEAQEQINEALNLRGYVVICSTDRHPVPDKVESFSHLNITIEHPFFIFAETDLQDLREQRRIWGFLECEEDPRYQYFYRAKSD